MGDLNEDAMDLECDGLTDAYEETSDEDLVEEGIIYGFTKIESRSFNDDKEEDNYPYEVLDADKIIQSMDECIDIVNDVLKLPRTTARILMNHYKWNQEKLHDAFFAADEEKFFKDANVLNPFNEPNRTKRLRPCSNESEDCEICFETFPRSVMTGIDCGHRFCRCCWDLYLTTKIMFEGANQMISCPASKCNILVDDDSVMNLVSNSDVKAKYQHLMANNFVECNRLLRWCPSAGCKYVIKVKDVDCRPVQCKDGHIFCFKCGEDWHSPIPCNALTRWLKKCQEESHSRNWLLKNTKECPKCNTPIELYVGCPHVICAKLSCAYEFCWRCLKSWRNHNFPCKPFNKNVSSANNGPSSRSESSRLLHHFDRYIKHKESLKLEHESYRAMTENSEMQTKWKAIGVEHLKTAFDILCKTRKVLMYTYVSLYYLKNKHLLRMIVHTQGYLELAIQSLSEMIKCDNYKNNLIEFRQNIEQKYT